MTKVQELAGLGQSIWLDYIRRAFLESGEFQELIAAGVSGVTSNPAIFTDAIAGSTDYDQALEALVAQGKSTLEIYESLAIQDIQLAADLLRPVYDRSGGEDGFVSLEVSPELANDTKGTIVEARRLYATLNRPNVLIKVPATAAGIPAIETLIGEGININVTLMFSLAHYDAVAEAYISGLEKLAANGGDLSQAASVASFFLSRIDSLIDSKLGSLDSEMAQSLQGKIAIANAKVTYQRFLETFSGERWQRLADQGARVQRVLWASTSTKNPTYPDIMYVDSLIGPDTVNTVPPATLQAFLDHGHAALTITEEVTTAQNQLKLLSRLNIDLDAITEQLQEEGVEKFAKPFSSMLTTIEEKVNQLIWETTVFESALGDYQEIVDQALNEIKADEIMRRIWAHDYTVWAADPQEITNRLGWLHSPENMADNIEGILHLVDDVRDAGYTHVLLLGMGGSSLAPEVFSNVFSQDHDGLELAILDSTDPGAVQNFTDELDLAKTLFVVSTKSGGTVETLSFFKHFYNRTLQVVGADLVGKHFVAITDEGSKLQQIAQNYDFRATFLNDPNIGGRYAALSYFGLFPAALVGVDLERLLQRAQAMAGNGENNNGPVDGDNLAGILGVIMGELAKAGRDKITLISSPELANFGDWVEQLIAESTGKNGTGILPIVGEKLGPPQVYGNDRLFAYLRLEGDDTHDAVVETLIQAGQPMITLHMQDRYDIGGQFFLWEMATAVAGNRLSIWPFDQPNVEAAKILARQMVAAYQEEGVLPAGDTMNLTAEALQVFLVQGQAGDYIALQAYVQPSADTRSALEALREKLRNQTQLATSLGYGPRFLHSTGQLHKGDAGNGLFVQFLSLSDNDIPIPDEAGKDSSSISFGVLKAAQALGDAQALRDANRRLIQFQVNGDTSAALQALVNSLD